MEYVLLISTVAGARRFIIGNTVIITDKARSKIKISGRTKHYLNVVDEQFSVQKMNSAIEKLQNHFEMEVKEFTVATVLNEEEYKIKWFIGSNKTVNNTEAAALIDVELCENNKNYKVARVKALKGVEVEIIPVEHFYRWSEEFKKPGGQAKIPRIMKEEDFAEFGNYVKALV